MLSIRHDNAHRAAPVNDDDENDNQDDASDCATVQVSNRSGNITSKVRYASYCVARRQGPTRCELLRSVRSMSDRRNSSFIALASTYPNANVARRCLFASLFFVCYRSSLRIQSSVSTGIVRRMIKFRHTHVKLAPVVVVAFSFSARQVEATISKHGK
jgi:hypothetical protein